MDNSSTYLSLEDVKRRVIAAICTLYRHDRELMETDANERSITHKLAEYLQREFPCWHVDCEYNRRGREPKRLPAISSAAARKVYPDIIVHRRLTDQNLLLIEVKKTRRSMKRDKEKLVAFSQEPEYRYQYGLLLVLPRNRGPEIYLFLNGKESDQWTKDLGTALSMLGYAPE